MNDVIEAVATFFVRLQYHPFLERLLTVALELVAVWLVVEILTGLRWVRSPRIAALLWSAVFIKATFGLLLPPFFTYSAPELAEVAFRPEPEATAPDAAPAPVTSPAQPAAAPTTAASASQSVADTDPNVQAARPKPPKPERKPVITRVSPRMTWEWIWATGFIVFGLLMLRDWAFAALLRGAAVPLSDRAHQILAEECTNAGIRRRPRLVASDRWSSPALTGLLRPALIVPAKVAGAGDEALRWIIRHELCHLRHGDLWMNALRQTAQTVFYFHPVVWWASRRWREFSEYACDRAAIRNADDAETYVRTLMGVANMNGRRRDEFTGGAVFGWRTMLPRRVEELLTRTVSLAPRPTWRTFAACGATMLMLVLVGGGIEIRHAAAEGKQVLVSEPMLDGNLLQDYRPVPPARTLYFLPDRSLGELVVNGAEMEAKGAISIPEGQRATLTVSTTAIGDLAVLASFPPYGLQELSLRDTPVTDADLQFIQGLTGLEVLNLFGTSITDEGAAYLANLTNMRDLSLNSTHVTGAAMQYVGEMKHLLKLSLNRTQVGDNGMEEIENLQNLASLKAWMIPVTDRSMPSIGKLKNLRWLNLEATKITDAGMGYIQDLDQLFALIVGFTELTDAGVAKIAHLDKLMGMSVYNTNVTEASIDVFAHLPKLATLALPVTMNAQAAQRLDFLPAIKQDYLKNAANAKPLTVEIRDKATGQLVRGASFRYQGTPDLDPVAFVKAPTGSRTVYVWPSASVTRIRAYAPGYVTVQQDWSAPIPAPTIVVQMERGQTIGGTVVDAAGVPVSGAVVEIPVLGPHNFDGPTSLMHTETTDVLGRWSCDIAPQDLSAFWIELSHPEQATTRLEAAKLDTAALQAGTASLRMNAPIVIAGTVTRMDGTPVEGARVSMLEPFRQGGYRFTDKSAVTNEKGDFVLFNPTTDTVHLYVAATGLAPAEQFVERDKWTEEVQIKLHGTFKLTGKVVSENGAPMRDVRVYLSTTTNGPEVSWSTTTDASGTFRWDKAPEAAISVNGWKDGYQDSAVIYTPGAPVSLVLILTPEKPNAVSQ